MRTHPSKTVATWLCLLLGMLGVHRWYLRGWRDVWLWLRWPFVLLGIVGVLRWIAYDQNDAVVIWLMPITGVYLFVVMLEAVILGLTSDEDWRLRFPSSGDAARSSSLGVTGVVIAVMLGSLCLISAIAFALAKYFEAQMPGSY